MEQTERITEMERRMESAAKAVMELSAALDNYEEAQEAIAALVLSEDGIWNLLSDVSELNLRIRKFFKK